MMISNNNNNKNNNNNNNKGLPCGSYEEHKTAKK